MIGRKVKVEVGDGGSRTEFFLTSRVDGYSTHEFGESATRSNAVTLIRELHN